MAGHTVHDMPQIGEVSPGLWLLGGFGGHGLNTTAMAGEIVARAIVEGDRTWQMFSPFALVWAGGAFGRAAQQVSEWARQAGERVEGILARRRKANGLRAEAVRLAGSVAASPAVVQVPPPERVEPAVEAAIESTAAAIEPVLVAIVEMQEAQSASVPPPILPESCAGRFQKAEARAEKEEGWRASDAQGLVAADRPRRKRAGRYRGRARQ